MRYYFKRTSTKFLLLNIFFSLWICSSVSAQQVGGQVIDQETGEPLPGVNIVVKNTTIGTSTDPEGNWELAVPSLTDTLIFSFVGFETREIPINGRTEINISLQPEALTGEEVVVIGYGTTSQRTLTQAVSRVSAEEIQDRPVSRIDQALQGQMTGVRVRQVTGQPGEPLEIRVRGSASISAGNDPLYVLDGVPVDDLGNISIDNIESIEVLKDAASTAIYGSRGSNGVVLLTTKQGRRGQTTFEASINYGVQTLEKKLDILSAGEWIDVALEAINKSWVAYGEQIGENYQASDPVSFRRQELGLAEGETSTGYIPDPRWLNDDPDDLAYIDWQDEFYNVAPMKEFQLAASGGDENLTYRISGNYLNQNGIAAYTSYDRMILRANFNVNFSESLTMGMALAPSVSWSEGGNVNGKDQQALGVLRVAPLAEPEAGIRTGIQPYPDYDWAGSYPSPVMFQKYATNSERSRSIYSKLYFNADLLSNLSLRVTGSWNSDFNEGNTYYPTLIARHNEEVPAGESSSGSYSTGSSNDYLFQSLLNYRNTIGGVHNFEALLGYAVEHHIGRGSGQSHSQFPDDLLQILNDSFSTVNESETSVLKRSLISYLTRVSYNYEEKYLVTASFRRDGSSRFGPNNRWGNFPSFSLGWRITQEPFMQSLDWLNELKLRYSWGINGNNSIPDYIYYGSVSRSNYSFGGNIIPGYTPSSLSNPNLGWETTRSQNFGLDFSLFSNRFELTVDYYQKLTTDLLLNVPVPSSTGFNNGWRNIGEVANQGIEFGLTARKYSGDFNWESTVNISFNSNEVKKLGPGDAPIHTGFSGSTELITVGQPLGTFYMYDAIGVYMNEEDLESSPHMSSNIIGDVKYRDVNGDGVITEDDRTIVGNVNPTYYWGFINSFNYKSVGLSFLIQGAGGNQIYGMLGRAIDRPGMGVSTNKLGRWRNRWSSPQDPGGGVTPRLDGTTGGLYDSRWLYDATYVRLKNVTLSYNLPPDLIRGLNNARIYISGENLLLFDNYYGGYSPEADNNSGGDYGGYPIARVFSFGVDFRF